MIVLVAGVGLLVTEVLAGTVVTRADRAGLRTLTGLGSPALGRAVELVVRRETSA